MLQILAGHTSPVASLAFNPSPKSTTLASVSWDKTLKIWNAIESSSVHETIELPSEGLCVAYSPDGQEVAVATLDCQISCFDSRTLSQTASIEGRNDIGTGISDTDQISAEKVLKGK